MNTRRGRRNHQRSPSEDRPRSNLEPPPVTLPTLTAAMTEIRQEHDRSKAEMFEKLNRMQAEQTELITRFGSEMDSLRSMLSNAIRPISGDHHPEHHDQGTEANSTSSARTHSNIPLVTNETFPGTTEDSSSNRQTVQESAASTSNEHAFIRGHAMKQGFEGSNSKVDPMSWITIYEHISSSIRPEVRVTSMPMYLTNEALHWYANEVARPGINSWSEVKAKFLARFGTAVVPPAVAAEQRIMSKQDTVQSYAQDKMRLLRLAETSNQSSLALLTAGSAPPFRSTLFSLNPQTFDEWLRVALTIENSLGYHNRFRSSNDVQVVETRNWNKAKFKNKRNRSPPPPYACKRCKEKGIEVFHWHNQCPNRSHYESAKTEDSTKAISNSNEKIQLVTQPSFVYLNVLLNGSKVRAFIDTGSTLTVASRSLANSMDFKLTGPRITVSQVTGPGFSLGSSDVILKIGHLSHKVTIHVFDRDGNDLLLGSRETSNFNLIIDCKSLEVVQKIGNKSEIINTAVDNLIGRQLDDNELSSIFPGLLPELFADGSHNVGRIKSVVHTIRIQEGTAPIHLRPYRTSPAKSDFIRSEIDKMLKARNYSKFC